MNLNRWTSFGLKAHLCIENSMLAPPCSVSPYLRSFTSLQELEGMFIHLKHPADVNWPIVFIPIVLYLWSWNGTCFSFLPAELVNTQLPTQLQDGACVISAWLQELLSMRHFSFLDVHCQLPLRRLKVTCLHKNSIPSRPSFIQLHSLFHTYPLCVHRPYLGMSGEKLTLHYSRKRSIVYSLTSFLSDLTLLPSLWRCHVCLLDFHHVGSSVSTSYIHYLPLGPRRICSRTFCFVSHQS